MKAMFWMKVKLVVAVACAALVVGGGVPLTAHLVAAEAGAGNSAGNREGHEVPATQEPEAKKGTPLASVRNFLPDRGVAASKDPDVGLSKSKRYGSLIATVGKLEKRSYDLSEIINDSKGLFSLGNASDLLRSRMVPGTYDAGSDNSIQEDGGKLLLNCSTEIHQSFEKLLGGIHAFYRQVALIEKSGRLPQQPLNLAEVPQAFIAESIHEKGTPKPDSNHLLMLVYVRDLSVVYPAEDLASLIREKYLPSDFADPSMSITSNDYGLRIIQSQEVLDQINLILATLRENYKDPKVNELVRLKLDGLRKQQKPKAPADDF